MWGATTASMWGALERFDEGNPDRGTSCGGHRDGRHVGGKNRSPARNYNRGRSVNVRDIVIETARRTPCGGHMRPKSGRHVGGVLAVFDFFAKE